MTETRKEFEERLLTELLKELEHECLSNLLSYAASYLKGESVKIQRPIDTTRAEIIDRYVEQLDTRIREVR